MQVGYVILWSRKSRQVGSVLSLAVVAGSAAALLVAPLNQFISSEVGFPTLAVYVAPVTEEFAKFGLLAILMLLAKNRFQSAREVSYPHAGMVAGTTFMLLERVTYATVSSLGLELTGLEEIPVHPVTTGLAALSIVNGKPSKRIIILLPMSILIHASFNYAIRSASNSQLPYVWTFALEGFWAAYLLMGFIFRRKKVTTDVDQVLR